jgi:hypothetical protein
MYTYFFKRDFSDTISRLILLTLVVILPFMGGCGEDENPIHDDHDHDHEVDAPLHADADGFNLEVNGTVVYHQHQGTHEGGLTVDVGEEIEVNVVFIDANEAEVHLDEVAPPPGEHDEHEHDHDGAEAFSLGLSGYDSSIIEIHLEHEEEHEHGEEEHDEDDHEDDHDDHDHEGEEHSEEELHFGLEGLKAGKTEIKLQLLHGDHPDFTGALLIPVTVQ